MRKILVGLIAAMMLFAFTACEQQMPKYPASEWDLEIAKVTFVSSATTFREGDTALNAVPVTVNVEYKNGDTTNGVVASLSTTEALVGGENIGTVDINGDSTADALVTFNAIEKTGLTINTDEATLSVKESEISIDPDNSKDSLEGITVTLTYADGYTVPAGDSWTSSWNGTTAASTTGAVVSYDGEEAIVEFTVTDRKPVTITALSAEYTDEETIVGEAFNASHVEVTATYSDGSKKDLTASEYYVKDQKTLPASTLTLTDKALDSVTIMAVEDIAKTATLSIPAGKNYITAVTAITPKTQGGPTAGATNVTIASYDVTVTTAFDDKGATKFDTTNATILDPTAPSEGVYAPRFEVKFGKNNAEKTVITAGSVTFPAAE